MTAVTTIPIRIVSKLLTTNSFIKVSEIGSLIIQVLSLLPIAQTMIPMQLIAKKKILNRVKRGEMSRNLMKKNNPPTKERKWDYQRKRVSFLVLMVITSVKITSIQHRAQVLKIYSTKILRMRKLSFICLMLNHMQS
jgi:hypothetical protein